AFLQKDAEAERLAFLRCDTEVHVEVAVGRGDPWEAPPHPLPVLLDVRQRRTGHQAKGDVPRVQMGKVPDLIDEHRTSRAASRRPTIDPRGEHEVVEDELSASFEQVEEAHLAGGGNENIVLVDSDHWQPSALRGQDIARMRGRLFLVKERVKGPLPFGLRRDFRKSDLVRGFYFHG